MKPASASPSSASSAKGLHTVSSGQTLSHIAREYQVTVDDLQAWNKLSNGAIKAGQTLIVSSPAARPLQAALAGPAPKAGVPVKAAASVPVKPAPTRIAAKPAGQTPETDPDPVRTETRRAALITTATPQERTVSDDAPSLSVAADEYVTSGKRENGLASVINERIRSNKLLALHRTAPVGSTINVRNSSNGRMVAVRVIGRLPDIGENERVVVKLSRKATEQLGAVDSRFLVEVSGRQ